MNLEIPRQARNDFAKLRHYGMNFQSLANKYVCDIPVYEPGKPIEEVARELGLKPETIIKLASNENALAKHTIFVKILGSYPNVNG